MTRFLRRIIRSISHQACVLMYHRIAEVDVDPWNLCVSPSHFEQQLKWLQSTGSVISVNELLQSLLRRKVTHRATVLTFDDGYEDNFTVARPLLEKYGLPATFFIPSAPIINQQPFWWDVLQQLVFETSTLPAELSLTVGTESVHVDLGNEAVLTAEMSRKQNVWKSTDPAPTKRCHLYLELWKKLRPLPSDIQQQVLRDLHEWAGISESTKEIPSLLSVAQVDELAGHSLITIGAHTHSHPALGAHSPSVQYQEISENKALLEHWCNRPIDSFAYPYGNYNQDTPQILQAAQFTIAFTTQDTPVSNWTNRFKVGRVPVPNCTGEHLSRLLAQML